eukprot:5491495-Lingulodinium_polyedra.AAC.1
MVPALRLPNSASNSAASSIHSWALAWRSRITGVQRAIARVQHNGRSSGRTCPLEATVLALGSTLLRAATTL